MLAMVQSCAVVGLDGAHTLVADDAGWPISLGRFHYPTRGHLRGMGRGAIIKQAIQPLTAGGGG